MAGSQHQHTEHQKQQPQPQQVNPDEARPLMELSYDKLVYAVGTKTGTFGVPGVREHCYMLKVCRLSFVVSSFFLPVLWFYAVLAGACGSVTC